MRTHISILVILTGLLLWTCSDSNGPAPIGDPPLMRLSIDSVSCLNGQSVELALTLASIDPVAAPDSINGFVLLLAYDPELLYFLSASPGYAVESWEYFTWRHEAASPPRAQIRIVGIRDLQNGDSHPTGQGLPTGVFARLAFNVASNRDYIGRETEISFWTADCEDNALGDATDPNLVHVGCSYVTNDSITSIGDTLDCEGGIERRADMEFVAGAIRIAEPPDDRPDAPITVRLESVAGLTGDTVESEIRVSYMITLPPQDLPLGGMMYTVEYDTSALGLLGARPGEQLDGWEYFDWKVGIRACQECPSRPGLQIVSIRELNDGSPSEGQTHPTGTVAILKFTLKKTLTAQESCDAINFWSNDVSHNGLSDVSGSIWFIPEEERGGVELGPDYDTNRCDELNLNCIPYVGFRKIGCAAQQ